MARPQLTLESPLNLVDDELLKYYKRNSYSEGFYHPTPKGVKQEIGLDLTSKENEGSQEKAVIHCKRAGSYLMAWIRSQLGDTNTRDWEVIRWRISRDPYLAWKLYDAGIKLIEADKLNGYIRAYYSSGIEIGGVGREAMQEIKVPMIVEDILKDFIKTGYLARISDDILNEGY